MIEAKPWDIGREVVFRPRRQHSLGGYKSADEFAQEEGVLTAIDNQDFVTVKFHGDRIPRKARAKFLSWKED